MGDAYPAPPHPLRVRLVAQALLAGKEGEPQVRECFCDVAFPQKRGTCYTMQAAFTIGYLTQQTRADIPCPDQLQRVLASALLSAPHPLRRIVAPSLSARGVRAKRRWRDGTAARATVRRPRSTASTSTRTSCCANRGANTEREQNRPGSRSRERRVAGSAGRHGESVPSLRRVRRTEAGRLEARWSGSSAEGAVPPSLQMHLPQLTQHAKAAASKTTTTRRGPHISSSSGLSATPKHSAAMVMR